MPGQASRDFAKKKHLTPQTNNEKVNTYWITTIIIAVMMTYSGFAYLSEPEMSAAFTHLGFPAYFRNELAFYEFIGVFLLLVPVFDRVKQWVYAGFAITFIAHSSSRNAGSVMVIPLIFFAVLVISYPVTSEATPRL